MKNKKLQALIGAIKNLYTIIQSKLRPLTCWQQAVGKTDCTDDVCCDCKKKKRIKKHNLYMMTKKSFIRLLGISDFYDFESLKKILKIKTNIDFTSAEFHIILFESDLKIWVISNGNKFYFVLDDGINYKYREVNKDDFKYKIEDFENTDNYGRMLVDGVEFPIIYNKTFSGSTETFREKIETLKQKK